MTSIGELATREVVTVNSEMSVKDAAGVMREKNVGSVVVVKGESGREAPLGILTDRDVTYEIVALDLDAAEVNVSDVMSLDLITISEDSDPSAALRVMGREGIRRLPVVDGQGRLTGLFALDDALQEIAGQLEDILLLVRRERKPGQTARSYS